MDAAVIGAAPGSTSDIDWFKTWRESPEYREVQSGLENLKSKGQGSGSLTGTDGDADYREFAAPFVAQLRENLFRVFQQYWRTPTYIYSKAALCTLISLFIGFVFFRAPNTIQGLQSQMFSIFNLFTIFGQIVQQTLPQFVIQRSFVRSPRETVKGILVESIHALADYC